MDKVARKHCVDMVLRDELTHIGKNGSHLENRVSASSIDWIEIGENVARNKGYDDQAREAVRGWLASPGHKANITNSRYRETGIAVIKSKTGFYYFVQVFLLRMPQDQ